MIRRREFFKLAAAAIASHALAPHVVRAQAKFPERPIHLIVPFPPGGGFDAVGSLNHLTGELLKSLAGIPDLVQVPYRGSGPATADTLSGQVAMVTPAVTGPLLEFHRTGKLRILAVTSPARLSAAPDIPTAVEAGVPGMISQQSIGLFAPAGTPEPIIAQIAQVTRVALAEPGYRRMLIESGFEPDLDSTPEKFRRLLEDEIARWTPLVKAIGVK